MIFYEYPELLKKGVINMKIVIPAVEIGGRETEIHENFGRANYLAVVNTENDRIDFIDNSAAGQNSGAGVGTAQLCADSGAGIAAAYHFGPKAYKALTAAGIKVLDLTDQKTIEEAYRDYQAGKLVEAKAGPGGHR
jgi:predicted Fe-Mo cluster-binding NifX family protein